MRLLAFDTSTDTLSVAVGRSVDGVPRVWWHCAAGGALASTTLLPTILRLMAQAGLGFGDLDAIAFGRGPGAFTGLRTACSVAQGLGFGAQSTARSGVVQVLPIDSLLAVAEEARAQFAPSGNALRVLAMLDARMDEIYAGSYTFDCKCWTQLRAYRLDKPEGLALEPGWTEPDCIVAGNVFSAYGERLPMGPGVPRVHALPTAVAMLRLAPAMLASGHGVLPEQALPTYIRDKVAQTSSERAAAKAPV